MAGVCPLCGLPMRVEPEDEPCLNCYLWDLDAMIGNPDCSLDEHNVFGATPPAV